MLELFVGIAQLRCFALIAEGDRNPLTAEQQNEFPMADSRSDKHDLLVFHILKKGFDFRHGNAPKFFGRKIFHLPFDYRR